MASLNAKDRVSLCQFTFSDGRRCRTPRTGKHPHFCFDHAQKEARARTAETLGKDLAYFFSADYLSACDLSSALGRLIPAVLRGDVKPRTARTVAYLAQTLLQTIRMSQDEYINAFGTDTWRKAIRNSVNDGYNYRCPPAHKAEQQPAPSASRIVLRGESSQPAQPQTQPPASQPVETPVNCHSDAVAQAFRSEEPASSSNSPLVYPEPRGVTHHSPLPQAPPPHTPLPPTSAEFAQRLLAGLPTNSLPATPHVKPTPPIPATQHAPPVPPAHQPACPEHGGRDNPPPTRPSTPPAVPPPPPDNSPQSRPTPQPTYNKDTGELHFDNTCRLRIDGKLV